MKLSSALLAAFFLVAPANAQWWDLGPKSQDLTAETGGRLRIGFESRARFETRTGQSFGRDPDISTGLFRTKLSVTYQPASWLKIGGAVQDSRAPWYGPNAPVTVRNAADLQEAYIGLFPERKMGFGMTAGRLPLNYGESRLIGTPMWSNVPRIYDHVRTWYRTPRANVEFLFVSPVKTRGLEFDRPVLGDRVWGTYNVFPNVVRKAGVDVYVLRHDQNRIGGFAGGSRAAGTDRLAVNTFGGRLYGPLGKRTKYSLEAAGQTGRVGPAVHRAWAWSSWVSRRWNPGGKTLDVTAEYKFASGTEDPRLTSKSATFDQLYPANHDKFGHQDLFGWRNLHDVRSLATLALTKAFSINGMFNDYWLASSRDALYNGSGKQIVRSASGVGGRHVGEAADFFATFKQGSLTWGAGVGRLFNGGFVRANTPGVAPTYSYVFQSYSF